MAFAGMCVCMSASVHTRVGSLWASRLAAAYVRACLRAGVCARAIIFSVVFSKQNTPQFPMIRGAKWVTDE